MWGIGDAIGGFIDKLFGFVFDLLQPVIEWLVEKIVLPVMSGVVEFVKCQLCNMLYNISIFVLRAIDFVELLFRSLADLPSREMAGLNVELSLNGQTGNILLQLLKSGSVQAAFLAMCIVGVFLIVVMTAFQIIKVEYTTEGAKNAKGPIFQKAFRGVSLLLLTPLLVVFGVVFANQLLNLLDVATKANASSTISGQVFATSASDAHYLEGELKYEFGENANGIIARQIQSQMLAYLAFFDTLIDSFTGDNDTKDSYDSYEIKDEDERNAIDNAFASQTEGHRYYLMSDVSKYYKYTEINYLLLILSGSLILKTLCFACFGLVIRLYKVAVLFIISPAIIGMSVVNEKALANWRKAFIGQVLAAYGVVIAINLFFIIVSVLLGINLKFIPASGEPNTFGILSDSMMTQLLRVIIVISGAVLIEKFSKDIGGYFGADDLLAPGQELAKKGLDTLKKVAMEVAVIVASIYTGGTGGAAIKAGAAAGKAAGKGIAKKVGEKAAKKAADKAGKKGVEQAGKKAADNSKKKLADNASKKGDGQKKPDSKDKKPDTGEDKKDEKPKDESAEAPKDDETKQDGAEENAPEESKDESQDGGEEEKQESGEEKSEEQPQEQSEEQSEEKPEEGGEENSDDSGEDSDGDSGDSEGDSGDGEESDESSDDESDDGEGDDDSDGNDTDIEEDDDEFMDDVLEEVSDRRLLGIDGGGNLDSFIDGVYSAYADNGGTMDKKDFARHMRKKVRNKAHSIRSKHDGTVWGAVKSKARGIRSTAARNTMNMASLIYGFGQGSHFAKFVNRHSDLVKKGANNLGADTFGQAYENAKYKRGQSVQRSAEAIFSRQLNAYESGGALEFTNQVIKKAQVEVARLPIVGEQILNRNRSAFRYLDAEKQSKLAMETVEELKSSGIMMDYEQVLKKLQSSGDIKLTASEIGSNLDLNKLRDVISYAYMHNGTVNQTELAQIFADAIADQVGDAGNVEMAALIIKLVNDTWSETQ